MLIDEDNRLSGKTKAAVLEGMEESSATLSSDYGNLAEGKMLPLFPLSGDFNDIEGPRFFMVTLHREHLRGGRGDVRQSGGAARSHDALHQHAGIRSSRKTS